ncbi:MAG: ATP-binding protein [Acidimicrobiales bacterium]|nr:ATP-binding protein [Acidimicrobiales bacterium]
MDDTNDVTQPDAGRLGSEILDLEAERATTGEPVHEVLEVELLPGVGGEQQLGLRDAMGMGGATTLVVLTLLNSLDELETATLSVLAPDIRDSLGISNGTMVFISVASSAFLVIGAVPLGWMADRFRRGTVIGHASLIFSAFVLLSGMAVNALMLFFTRLGVGVAKSNTNTAHGSLLADQYPIETRGRVNALTFTSGRIVATLSPLAVGAVAAMAGGSEGWRWSFILLALPVAVVAFLAYRLPEPPRGQYEKKDILGDVIDDAPASISMEAAFARLLQIKTLTSAIFAFAALGFGLFTVGTIANLHLEDEYGLGTFGRGAVGTVSGVAVLCVLPFVGKFYDGLYTRDPSMAMRVLALLIAPTAILYPLQFMMPNAVAFAAVAILPAMLNSAAFAMVGPLIQTIVPYQLRGVGGALGAIYIFCIGAVGGALLSALFLDSLGARLTVTLIAVPSSSVGAFLLYRGSTSIRDDLSRIVHEIREEKDEHERQQTDPERIPAIQASHLDFSYGQVQILFDVSFEVRTGEVLALLGTNGAGKSTVLRAIAGLGTPSRGVVRMNGRSITFVSPEERTRMGLHLLPGGKGVFADLTVDENMETAMWNFRGDPADAQRRVDAAMDVLPELRSHRHQIAGSLSGGQQQLLALARVLAREPEILMIDELSLGLAPVVVERLVEVVGTLRDQGMTIIVVEQSLNVASAVADRAVFLEKGHVRFEGPISELAARGDLARAVFLGDDGG